MQVSKLKLNPDNPRIITDAALDKIIKSIDAFPEMMVLRPIIYDENFIVLGGNVRLSGIIKKGLKTIPDNWTKQVKDLSPEQKKEFIIKDNNSFGEWDFDELQNWDADKLIEWGMELPKFATDEDFGTEFSLANGDKSQIEQITFTLSAEQAKFIKEKLGEIKSTDAFKYEDTQGNDNSNGNALYIIVKQWSQVTNN